MAKRRPGNRNRRRQKQFRKTKSQTQHGKLQDAVTPGLKSARTLWLQGDHPGSLRLFEKAMCDDPRNVRPVVDAARAYATKYDIERTESLLERLRNMSASEPGVHHLAGDTFSRLKMLSRAVACYERASSLPGVLPVTWVELASLYERSNRVTEAAELVDRALRSEPGMPLALLVRAQLERREGFQEQAESTLHDLMPRVAQGSDLFCRACAELASIHDQWGDYDGAMEAIAPCKSALLARGEADWKASQRVLGRFEHMIDTITESDFRRWHEQGKTPSDARVALLTGFPRSGTTLLEQVLDAHPDLVSSEERDFVAKEMFPSLQRELSTTASIQDVLHRVSPERIDLERRRYFSVMEWMLGESIAGRVHLDKNPAYNLTIPMMLRLFPELRLLVALRDPRDVVLSCYLRYLPLNPVSVRFLTVERTAERYALDMRAWTKFKGLISAPWLEVRYEDTVADLSATARRALAALDLAWTPEIADYRQRSMEKQISSPTYEEVLKPVHSRAVGRWKNYEKYLAPALTTLEPWVREFGYD